jgi:hypothetical protein
VTTVYASRGGNAFHGDPACRAREAGRDLNDWEPDWVPGCRVPRTYAVEPMTIPAAMGTGKLPCLVCLPSLGASWFQTPCEDDFGHQPVTDDREFFGEVSDEPPVCARCTRTIRIVSPIVVGQEPSGRAITRGAARIAYEVAVLWPCTSAVVLGLTA